MEIDYDFKIRDFRGNLPINEAEFMGHEEIIEELKYYK
jgi:hypothetical protein